MTTQQLLVPIIVEAFAAEPPTEHRTDIGWSPQGPDYLGAVNSFVAPGPDPFFQMKGTDRPSLNAAPQQADAGVIVRWIVPDGLRRGVQLKSGALRFPALPDQWIVVRFARQGGKPAKPRAWFLDASVIAPQNTTAGKRTSQLIVADQAGKAPRAVTVGRSLALEDYRPSDGDRVRLTAVGGDVTGSPTFTASVAENRNMLSWQDDLDDLRTAGALPDDLTLSYQVLGWYRQAQDEPLASIDPDDLRDHDPKQPAERKAAVLFLLDWKLDQGDSTVLPDDLLQWRTFYHGMVAHLNYWDKARYQGGKLGSPDPTAMTVGVGHNAIDALVALVDNGSAGADGATMWQALEAIAYRQTGTLLGKAPWKEASRELTVHQSWFVPYDTGVRWTIRQQERDAATLAVGSDQVGSAQRNYNPQPTTAQLDLLHKLNQVQGKLDRQRQALCSAQIELYARWWLACQAFKVKDRAKFTNATQACATLGTQIKALKAVDHAAEVASLVEKLTSALDGSGLELLQSAAPRFWTPTEPAVVVRNPGRQSSHSFPSPLLCRTPAQIPAALSRDGEIAGRKVLELADAPQLPPALASSLGGFPGAAQTLGALLAEAAQAEQALATLAGSNAEAKLETLPLSRLARFWGNQPWSPLFLDWQVTFYPSGDAANDFSSAWQTARHDLEPVSGQAGTHGGIQMRGRSVLTPMLGRVLADPLHDLIQLLTGEDDDQTGKPGFDPRLRALLHPHLAEWKQQLLDLEDAGLLGQNLTGFHQFFLGREPGLLRPRPDSSHPWLAQSLDKNAADSAVADLLAQRDRRPAPLAPSALGAPAAAQGDLAYSLLRAGSFSLDRLWLVDDFGQWVDILGHDRDNLKLNPHVQWPDAQDRVTVPPRLLQPARLDFRFVAPEDVHQESGLAASTNPILGWVYHNYQDQALVICDRDGRLLGELTLLDAASGQVTARWVCLTDPAPADPTSLDVITEPRLRAFVAALVNGTPQPRQRLQDLLLLIDDALGSIRPVAPRQGHFLFGRPLALVSARLGLQVMGRAWTDPLGPLPPSSTKGTGDPLLDKLSVPVQLGVSALTNDGLIGFYGDGFEQIQPARLPDDLANVPHRTSYVDDPRLDAVKVGLSGWTPVTLLMEPHGVVHATAGILPAKTIQLPAAYLDVLQAQMELSFQVAPVLVHPPGAQSPLAGGAVPPVEIPVPAGSQGEWRFHGPWNESDHLPVAPPERQAHYDFARLSAVEGRLVLRAERGPQKTTSEV